MTVPLLERRLRALEAQLGSLAAWRDARRVDLGSWTFQAEGLPPQPISPGQPWPLDHTQLRDRPALLRSRVQLPADWSGPAVLELDLGGEGLVRVHAGDALLCQGGLNPYHRRFPLGERVAGEELQLEVETVPRGLFGSPTRRPHLELAQLCAPQPEVGRLHAALHAVAAAVRALAGNAPGEEERADHGADRDADQEVAARLLNLAERVLARLDWPSGADAYLARLPLLGGGESFTSGLWSLPPQRPELQPPPEAALARAAQADAELRAGLEQLTRLFPPRGQLEISGHAHLDLGWLWPVHETRRKGRRTLSTVLELMERYPDFTFNQSSAQLYAWLEQDDPALFDRLEARVREGRLEPVGGMWVEPDAQMSGGEALARQLLYGQRYFRSRFGRGCSVAWLPDTFGFSPALPQLLLQADIPHFFTTKLNWNERTRFPHDLFQWEGLDGSRVLAHTFDNSRSSRPGLGNYNGDLAPHDLLGTWRHFRGKTLPAWGEGAARGLFTFGYGDGGGGPSAEMLDAYAVLKRFPALPALSMTRVDDFFARLPTDLPVWAGELYLELHRGTLTSQARIKRANRQAEHRLLEAEVLCALGGEQSPDQEQSPGGAQAELERLWKVTLLNQFHDILPGSSVREVYETALPELEGVQQGARALIGRGQRPEENIWTVLNPASWDRPLSVLLPRPEEGRADWSDWNGRVTDDDGATLPCQPTEGGLLVHAPGRRVPAFGALRLRLTVAPSEGPAANGWGADGPAAAGVRARLEDGGAVLENDRLRAVFAPDGTLTRLHDRLRNQELLGPGGHRLLSFPDLPYAWEAWDVAHGLDAPGELPLGEALGGEVQLSVQPGPLEATLTVRRRWRESRVVQIFALRADSARLDVRLELDWHERRTLLRAVTDVNVRSHEAWFETALGAQARPTHRNGPAAGAMFEVSAHRWADLSQPGRGLSLLNDGRYGHSALGLGGPAQGRADQGGAGGGRGGSELALSLVRGPMWPDPQADLGLHQLSYSLYPHGGDWRAAHTVREGFDLNSPLLALPGGRAAGPAPQLGGLPLMLSALKRPEEGEGLILRLYEPHGEAGRATLSLPGLRRAERVNLLEETVMDERTLHEMTPDEKGLLTLEVRPFELITLRLTLRGGEA